MHNFALFTTFLMLLSGVSSQGSNCRFIGDVVFILDESGSVGSSNFQMIRDLISGIVNSLDVDSAKEKVRVGVVTFDNNSVIRIPLGGYTNKADLVNKIQNNVPYNGGNTNVLAGLNNGLAVLLSGLTGAGTGIGNTRPGVADGQVPRIFFVFGDGFTNNAAASLTLASQIKNGSSSVGHVIMIFSLFIGSNSGTGFNFFRSLASTPTNMWFANVSTFNSVDPSQITDQFCDTGSMTFGDVHFTTHDGVMYTFNGAGDYIYMKTNNKVDVHVRDVYVGRATALAAMALQDKKSGSVMELWWDGDSSDRLAVNVRHAKQENKVVAVSREIQVHHPFHVQKMEDGLIKIKHAEFPGFSVLAHYGGRASFQVRVPKEWETTGLGGNNNGQVEDDLCNRSGKCVSLNATNKDVHQIGLDWSVLPSELLFEKWMPIQDWEIRYHPLELNAEQIIAARKVCGNVQPCIYDYISTGSEEYAKHTKKDYYSHILNEGKLVYVGDRY